MVTDFHALSDAMERYSNHRYAFRAVALADAWPLWETSRNPLFNRFLTWDQPDTVLQIQRRVELISRAHRRGELTAMAGVLRDTGEWVTLIRLMPWSEDSSALETGIWTHERHWNGRASLDLARMGVQAVFQATPATAIVGRVAAENTSCERLLRLMGMSPGQTGIYAHESGRSVALRKCVISRPEWAVKYASYSAYSLFGDDEIRTAASPAAPPRQLEALEDAAGACCDAV